MAREWKVKEFAGLGALLGLLYGAVNAIGQAGRTPEAIARTAGAVVGEIIISVAGFVLVAWLHNVAVRWAERRARRRRTGSSAGAGGDA